MRLSIHDLPYPPSLVPIYNRVALENDVPLDVAQAVVLMAHGASLVTMEAMIRDVGKAEMLAQLTPPALMYFARPLGLPEDRMWRTIEMAFELCAESLVAQLAAEARRRREKEGTS